MASKRAALAKLEKRMVCTMTDKTQEELASATGLSGSISLGRDQKQLKGQDRLMLSIYASRLEVDSQTSQTWHLPGARAK